MMSPLRGLTIYLMTVPMTYVMGYCYIAPDGAAFQCCFPL